MINIFCVFFYIYNIEVFKLIFIINFLFINIYLNNFLAALLKKGAFAKVVKIAVTIGKNLGFDLKQSCALYLQLRQYKENEPPFDLPFGYGFDEPFNWWNLIETSPNPDSLTIIALHLFSICPNSASCERGFSTLGWLT